MISLRRDSTCDRHVPIISPWTHAGCALRERLMTNWCNLISVWRRLYMKGWLILVHHTVMYMIPLTLLFIDEAEDDSAAESDEDVNEEEPVPEIPHFHSGSLCSVCSVCKVRWPPLCTCLNVMSHHFCCDQKNQQQTTQWFMNTSKSTVHHQNKLCHSSEEV